MRIEISIGGVMEKKSEPEKIRAAIVEGLAEWFAIPNNHKDDYNNAAVYAMAAIIRKGYKIIKKRN